MQRDLIGFTGRMRILAMTLLLSSALAFFPIMRLTKSPSDLQGARSKVALSDQQKDNLLGEQMKEFQDGWKSLFAAGSTGFEEEVKVAPPSKKPEDDKEVPPPAIEPAKVIASIEEKKEAEVVKLVDDELSAHQAEPTKVIEQPKQESTVAVAAKPEPVTVPVVTEEAPKLEVKEELKVETKVEPKVEAKVEPIPVIGKAVVEEEEVKEARVAPSAAIVKPKPIPKAAAKPASVPKPVPSVPVMFTMNEVALKTEPALINERNEDEAVGMALRDIPIKSVEEVTKVDDTKDVLKAQQAITRSFFSLLSSDAEDNKYTAVETKSQTVEKKIEEVVKPVVSKAEVIPVPAKATTVPPVVATKKEETNSNPLEGFLGFLKNDPALEQQRQQQAAKQQKQAPPKPQPVAIKQEVKLVPPPPTPPKATVAPPAAPIQKQAVPVPAPVKLPAPMPVVSTAKKPEPPALDKLFGFLKSDPAFEYAQQLKAKEKANNRPTQPPAVARALFSPSPPAPPAEPMEPVFKQEKFERPEVKAANMAKKAEESSSLPKINIPFLNSNDKKKDDAPAAVVAKQTAPEVFERPVVAARSSSSTAPVKKAKIIISTTQPQAQPQAAAAPVVEAKKEVKKVEETKPAVSLPSFGFFGSKTVSPPAAPILVKKEAVLPKPAPIAPPAPAVIFAKKEETSKPKQGGGGLFSFLGNSNKNKDTASSQSVAPKAVVTPPKPAAPVVASKPAVVAAAAKVVPAAPLPATTAAPTISKPAPAAGGGLFGFLNPSPLPPKSIPAAVSKSAPVIAAKVEAKKPVVPAPIFTPEPIKKAQTSTASSGGLFGMFGGNNNKPVPERKAEEMPVVVAPAKVTPKAAAVVPKIVASAAPVVVPLQKKVEATSSSNKGGLFGMFGGAKKADSTSDSKKPETVVAAKPAFATPTKASPVATKATTSTTNTVASSSLSSSSSNSKSGGLFGGFLGGGNNKPAASTPSPAEKATAMNPTFQKLVSKTLKNDSGKLATFQRSTDTLRAGTLDASRYVSAMDTLFGGAETLGSILPPLIAELPEKDVAKKLQAAYDKYVKAIKPSAAAVKTVGAVIKVPEKVPVAKRGVVESKMKAVAAGQLTVKDFVDYLNKDIGATRTKGFAADIVAMLPKEKAAEFTKLVAQLK